MSVNIFANANKPVAHNGRNGFDLSSAHTLTMRCGVLRPVIVQDTVPNSSFKINCGDIVRTSGLQTAAFLRGRHELDFFFVPYRQLASKFDNIVFGRGDVHSPLLSDVSDATLPTYELRQLYQYAADVFCVSWLISKVKKFIAGGAVVAESSLPLEYYNCIIQYFNGQQSVWNPDAQLTWDDSHLQFVLDNCCFEHVDLTDPIWIVNCHPIGASIIQLLSSLGYGDIYMRVNNLLLANQTDWNTPDELDESAYRIGKAIFNFFQDFEDNRPTLVTLSRLVAYQKIWHDVYRDSINDNSSMYERAISLDEPSNFADQFIPILYHLNNANPSISDQSQYYVMRPRLRQYKKDLNTGLYPSTQFGDMAGLDFSDISIINNASPINDNRGASVLGTGNGSRTNALVRNDSLSNTSWNLSGTPSAYDIKYTLALQKYKESLMRAGSRTRDLLKAEFGVESRYINDFYVHSLGSFGGSLDVNKVSATAETGDYSVGDLAANVFTSLQGDTIKFTCNDYGVIIGVMSFLPEMFHNATGISPFVYKREQFDFFHEAFENLGLQPVGNRVFDGFVADDTHGFGARFNEYKQNLDLCHDTFMSAPNWRAIAPAIPPQTESRPYIAALANDGVNSNYVTTRPIMQDLSLLTDRNYIFPDAMDSLFRSIDDGTPETAHFDVALQCNMTAVLPMSVLGMM